jgi:VanZ family protein
MTAIFIASSIPDVPPLPGGISDKQGHSFGYAILGAVVLRALAGGRMRGVTWRTALGTVLLATLYGVSDEIHQSFVPNRTPDVYDVLADATGAAAATTAGVALATLRASSMRARAAPPD